VWFKGRSIREKRPRRRDVIIIIIMRSVVQGKEYQGGRRGLGGET